MLSGDLIGKGRWLSEPLPHYFLGAIPRSAGASQSALILSLLHFMVDPEPISFVSSGCRNSLSQTAFRRGSREVGLARQTVHRFVPPALSVFFVPL